MGTLKSTWDKVCEFSEYRFQEKVSQKFMNHCDQEKLNNEFFNSRTIYYYNVLGPLNKNKYL